MGAYINPAVGTKEGWLADKANATEIFAHEFNTISFAQADINGERLVVLVDNGNFSAAGIMFSQKELEYWRNDSSGRLKKFYRVKTALLMDEKVSDLKRYA